MVDIQFVKASDYCESVVDGTHDSPKPCDEGFYLITSKHLSDYEIDFASAYKISEADYNLVIKRSSVEQWDILFSMIGTVGRVYIERNSSSEYACKNVGIFKCGGDRQKALWLYYVLKSPYSKQYIAKVLAGSTQSYISLGNLRAFPVPVIDDEKRNRIVEVLSDFDKKIEINNKIIKTIGLILRAKHEQLTIEAKETKKLDDIADVIDCLHSKKPVLLDEGENYIQLNAIGNDGLLFPDKISKISLSDYEKWTSRIEVTEGDCVITNVGRIGAVAKIPFGIRSAIGRNMTAIRLKKDFDIPTFLIQTLISDQMRREIDKKTDSGTIMGSLNVRSIPSLIFPWPSFDDIKRFEEQASQMRKLIEIKINENISLKTMRDALLPRLLSGEIELKN